MFAFSFPLLRHHPFREKIQYTWYYRTGLQNGVTTRVILLLSSGLRQMKFVPTWRKRWQNCQDAIRILQQWIYWRYAVETNRSCLVRLNNRTRCILFDKDAIFTLAQLLVILLASQSTRFADFSFVTIWHLFCSPPYTIVMFWRLSS